LSAEEIFALAQRQHPRPSLATVYRTLRLLTELGLVRELRLNGDRYRYEVERGQAHQHMVCLGCGKVIEFTCSHCNNVHRGLADQYGFQITNARVKLMGYCADCRARAQSYKGDISDENRYHRRRQ
jgi:Fur family ferric uptake transcriptional regulator